MIVKQFPYFRHSDFMSDKAYVFSGGLWLIYLYKWNLVYTWKSSDHIEVVHWAKRVLGMYQNWLNMKIITLL